MDTKTDNTMKPFRRFSRLLLPMLALLVGAPWGTPATTHAAEIGYVEDFALAKDREQALKQLIPGTREYYYYNALHLQNTEQYDKVEALLKLWIKRYGYTARVWEIKNRQALLNYAENPKESLEYIRGRLGIHFNHHQESLGKERNLPMALDQNLISRQRLVAIAMRSSNTSGFEDSALEWLVATKLDAARRRHMLQRLTRPDYPNLVNLIVQDLQYKYSRGFGSMTIHRQLLLPQLEELVKLKGDLLNQTNFVNTYLSKLRPNADVDWLNNVKEQQAYLDRLWAFADRLAPVHNSLKAHILYHQLQLDRSQGKYDKKRFMRYLQLPRHVSYIEPKFMAVKENRKYAANLNANYQSFTLLAPVRNDEPLVRSYFQHFFQKETDYKAYTPYVLDTYLKRQFAETKIVNGLGDPEQWYSMLSPSDYQRLKERVDLDFDPTNKKVYAASEPVSIGLHVKNAATLIVKVYKINAKKFYQDNLRELDTDINLDGLVANEEKTIKYSEPALRRVRRQFEFPQITEPGAYVIDFIGNGQSSRVLIRKGRLRHLSQTTPAGQMFQVLDETNKPVRTASIWHAGRTYVADKDGRIMLPFSNRPGRQAFVLMHGELATLSHFTQQNENYQLAAGIYVDREALLQRQAAEVVIRPGLNLNGTPITLSLLEDVRLIIQSTDQDGTQTTKEVTGFKVFEDRESTFTFQTPPRLQQIGFTLQAKVAVASRGGQKVTLTQSTRYGVNQIDRTDKTQNLHLARFGDQYIVELLGRSGESRPGQAVNVQLKHRDFKQTVNVSLQSDNRGRVHLGELKDIAWVRATDAKGTGHTWQLKEDRHSYHQSVHGVAGGVIRVPTMVRGDKPLTAQYSLLELRSGTFVTDRFNALGVANGYLTLSKLPRGDYDLLLKRSNTRVFVRVTEGTQRGDYVLGENRQLEVRNDRPLQVSEIETEQEGLTIQLQGTNAFTRVHVFATRYLPAFSAYGHLGKVADPEPYILTEPKAKTTYIQGRNIGDEYRYILERKYAKKHAGNMLTRPGLLLNPWAIRETDTGRQHAAPGTKFGQGGGQGQGGGGRAAAKRPDTGTTGDFANLDFLSSGSAILLNLSPDKNGKIMIDRKELGDHQHLHIVAIDPSNTVVRSVSMKEVDSEFIDLRLTNGLDPAKHYTEQKQISIVGKDAPFMMNDITTSRFEAYDSLARVYALLATLNRDPKLVEFGFVLNWPKMDLKQKNEKYSKYASHELNFFIARKDPVFFRQVVAPYLANKRDKTFMDRYLLGENLREYREPWSFNRLNTVERILMAQRIVNERKFTARHVRDQYELIPPNPDRYDHLFRTALKGHALDTGDQWGFADALDEAKPMERLERDLREHDRKKTDNAPRHDGGFANGRSSDPQAGATPRPSAPTKPGYLYKKELERLKGAESKNFAGEKMAKEAAESANRSLRQRDAKRKANTKGKAATGKDAQALYDRFSESRRNVRQYYRKLEKTKEWVENNYYKLPIQQQIASLVTTNAFWNDFAHHPEGQPFYSTHIAEASRNFTEMMFAVSVLDLPFEPAEHDVKFDKAKMTLTPGSSMLVFHKQIRPAPLAKRKTPILVSQNFFRHGDRYRMINGEKVDKYVTDEFLVHTVYGCQVVVTNPTSTRQKLEVLLQVPAGAIPVLNGQYTRSVQLRLNPYSTQQFEYYFYFPAAGDYNHYPVHVAKSEEVIAFAEPVTLKVVNELTNIDKRSWAWISQFGTLDQVTEYLTNENLYDIDLAKIAWRMKDADFFTQTVGLLTRRHAYNHTLWSYAIKHDVLPPLQEYLKHSDSFVQQCGAYLVSKPLTIDPVVRHMYEHMEYAPLVNARAHQLGKRRQIVNERVAWQYHRLLNIQSYKRDMSDDDLMATSYYLLLQDRVDEGKAFFDRVNRQKLTTKIQYDYLLAYLDFYNDKPTVARDIADRYAKYPVDRWRNRFAAIASHLDEIEGKTVQVVDKEDRTEVQTKLAATEATFDFTVESRQVKVNYQNVEKVTVNYYLMDIELLFSRNPFVQQQSNRFSYIKPNASQSVKLPKDKVTHRFDLPKAYHNSNVLVEILANGKSKSQAYFANSLAVQLIEDYGQVKVTHSETRRPLSKVYVKVYGRMADGSVRFYKDGYTDLRGRFDYSSLNTNELDGVQRFSVLVLSDKHGAVVRETAPPKR